MKSSFLKVVIFTLVMLGIGLYVGSNFSRLLINGNTADVQVTSIKVYGTPGKLWIKAVIENHGPSDKYPDLKMVWIGSKIRPEVYVAASEYPHDLLFRKPTLVKFEIERPADAKQFLLVPVYPKS